MIGWYVHHHGSGHATRACSLAAAVGEPVTAFSSLPRPDAWPEAGEWVQLPSDADPAPTPDQDTSAGGALHWAPLGHPGYSARMATIARWIADEHPTGFVVDVSVEVTALARLMGVPTVVMAMRGDRSDSGHHLAYTSATTLLAPWPAACPEPWWPQRWMDKTVHAGGISRFDGRAITRTPQPRHGVLLWGRGGTEPDLTSLYAATPGWTWTRPTGSPDQVWDALCEADTVVLHAGQNAVAEVAAARRPAVVIADPRPFGEQAHTAAALNDAGLAETVYTWPTTEEWAPLLRGARELGGFRWSIWNDGRGVERAAAAIRDVAARHRNTGATDA